VKKKPIHTCFLDELGGYAQRPVYSPYNPFSSEAGVGTLFHTRARKAGVQHVEIHRAALRIILPLVYILRLFSDFSSPPPLHTLLELSEKTKEEREKSRFLLLRTLRVALSLLACFAKHTSGAPQASCLTDALLSHLGLRFLYSTPGRSFCFFFFLIWNPLTRISSDGDSQALTQFLCALLMTCHTYLRVTRRFSLFVEKRPK
jgi:hypothetical protein